MKRILIACCVFLLMTQFVVAQKINGQWRGFFNSKGDIVASGAEDTEFVLEIEINGSTVTGFSYTYFEDRKFYVICSLKGTYDKKDKSLVVTEIAKVKGSTPPGWSDCLQTHILTYNKTAGLEEMKGSWKTAPGQRGDCGTGVTTLTRRTLSKNLASFNKPKTTTPFSAPAKTKNLPDLSDKNKKTAAIAPPVAKIKPVIKPAKIIAKQPVKKDTAATVLAPIKTVPEITKSPIKKQLINIPVITNPDFEKRGSEVLKTIEITGEEFKVALYDNGVVDGDSISLFYNGKLILSHRMLSEKAITLTLDATTDYAVNELTMYADNLGSIPPNTALMVVTDGDNRYEVRISSDLKKSGTIRFVHKAKKE